MKKIFSLLLSILMLSSVFGISSAAQAKQLNTSSSATVIKELNTKYTWNYVYDPVDYSMEVWFSFTCPANPAANGSSTTPQPAWYEIYITSETSNFSTTIDIVNPRDGAVLKSSFLVQQSSGMLSYSMTPNKEYRIKLISQPWSHMGMKKGDKTKFTIKVIKHKHVWEQDPTFSTPVDDIRVYRCPICEDVKYENVPAKVTWSGKTRYVYDGKAHSPSFYPKDSWGNTIKKEAYTKKGELVTKDAYSAKIYATNETTPVKPSTIKGYGAYHCVVKMKYPYKGTYTYDYQIVPQKPVIKSVAGGSKKITVKWNKLKGVTGYVIQYSTDKNFKKNKGSVTVKGAKNTSKTIKKLIAKKKYYVRIYAWKTVKNYKGQKVYCESNWSKVSGAKTK